MFVILCFCILLGIGISISFDCLKLFNNKDEDMNVVLYFNEKKKDLYSIKWIKMIRYIKWVFILLCVIVIMNYYNINYRGYNGNICQLLQDYLDYTVS